MSGLSGGRIAAGAAAGVALCALVVQPFATELRLPPRPNVACDSLNEATVVAMQLDEGFARATYTNCGARLTGNAPDLRAPWIAILGDSYIEARQVNDKETVGARLESISREAGKPVNVRQYGWAGAPPGQYVAVAPLFKNRYLSRAVIVLSMDDFGNDTSVHADVFRAVQPAALGDEGLALVTLARRRWALVIERSPGAVQRLLGPRGTREATPEVPKPTAEAAVRALKGAFGDKLLLVYLSSVQAGGDDVAPAESAMLDACARSRVQCIGMRSAMLDMRAQGHLARGFGNTTIGVGHLNAQGHDLLAREIWKAVR